MSTFLRPNVCEKFFSFCQVLKSMHTKENWFFFLPHGVDRFTVLCPTQYKKLCYRRRTTRRAVRQSKSCQLLHNCIATSCTTNEVTDLEYHRRRTCNKLHVYIGRLVAQHSGRTSVSDRRTFPVLRSTCS